MDVFLKFITNKYIYVPVLLWFAIQCFKVITELVVTKKFNFKRIMGAGGMPSSHAAIVVSLTTLIGKNIGVDTPLFALALIVSLVVMYDAAGVRRAAGKQAVLLNKIVQTPRINWLTSSRKISRGIRAYTFTSNCRCYCWNYSRIDFLILHNMFYSIFFKISPPGSRVFPAFKGCRT